MLCVLSYINSFNDSSSGICNAKCKLTIVDKSTRKAAWYNFGHVCMYVCLSVKQ